MFTEITRRLIIPRMKKLCVVLFCFFWWNCFSTSLYAREQQAPSSPYQQTSVIVFVDAVATTVNIAVDSLKVYQTDHVFGVWNYQYNLTSWLDTHPQRVDISIRLGNKEAAYCRIEVREMITGDPAHATIVAEKTVRASEIEKWNREITVLSLDIARPAGNVRPLWVDHDHVVLDPVTRKTSIELLREIHNAIRQCDTNILIPLVEPALTNQAMMEGVPPELLKKATVAQLKRYCIPNIPVAETREAYNRATYMDIMAPFNSKTYYSFLRDDSRKDGKGNLFAPKEPIRFTASNLQSFVARVFLSYPDEKRDRRFVSRFFFERTK